MRGKFGLLILAIAAGCVPAFVGGGAASAATFTVGCNIGDLRDALNDAEAVQGPHTIILDAGCTYRFGAVDSATNNDNALPVLTRDITIEGNGATFERLAGAPNMRFLEVRGGDTVTIRDLTMRHGSNPPPDGQVTSAPYAGASNGGAVRCTDAELVIEGVTFEDNEASNGGAVFTESCNVTLDHAVFSYNRALDGDGGGMASIFEWEQDCTQLISHTDFLDNSATGDGGGLFANTFLVDISASSFRRNFAGDDGGGMSVQTPMWPHLVSIEDTTVSRNIAEDMGGGIMLGTNHETSIWRSSIWGNSARLGGGIAMGDEAEIVLTTISGNTASDKGGGIAQYDWGSLVLNRATVADNDAGDGTAHALHVWGEIDILNTLFAYSGNAPAGALCAMVSGGWAIWYNAGSLAEGGCGTATSIAAGAAGLEALDQNGGPTRTHALGFGSAAKDAGDQAECQDLEGTYSRDQRGAPYWGIDGATCDVGAYEWQLVATPAPFPY